jgi:hypothetical protein
MLDAMRQQTATTPSPGLQRQRCVRCGYDGDAVQARRTAAGERRGSTLLICPNCQQDLYTRPPRSYAELEGLEAPVRYDTKPPSQARPGRRTIRNYAVLAAAAAAATLRPKQPTGAAGVFTKLELVLLLALLVLVSTITISRIATAIG